jgi:predicted metal-binding membrane protein
MFSVVESDKLASLHRERLHAGFRRAPLVMVRFDLLRGGFCQLCVHCVALVMFVGVVSNSLLS